MKHLFIFLIVFFANTSDDEFDFVHLASSLDDFEIVDSSVSNEWNDLSVYYFRQLPCSCQMKILEQTISRFAANDIWDVVSLVDKSFIKEQDSLKNKQLLAKKKDLALYKNKLNYKAFLFSAFRQILICYQTNQYKNYVHDVLVLKQMSSVAQEFYKEHVYLEWPYCLQKFSILSLHNEIRKDIHPAFDDCDYLLKGFEVHKSSNAAFFTRPIYSNFENPQKIFAAALTELLLLKYENDRAIIENYSQRYKKYITEFLHTQTEDMFTIPSLNLRVEVEKLFFILGISVDV